jgi:type I restriction enzyme S subunit
MSKWPFVKVGSLSDLKNGLNFSRENWGRGLKVIGVTNFQDYLYPKYDEVEEINPNGVVRDVDYLEDGDVLFVRSNGNPNLIGRSLYIKNLPDKMSHSGFTIRLRFKSDKVFPPFYVYLFKSSLIRAVLSIFGGGTNINNLNQKILSNLDVPVPSVATQMSIAAILSAYDELIENNKRRITLLEKIAEEHYREWFVRLRFPGFKKARFIKGIPATWRIKRFSEIVDFTMGQSPPSKSYNESGDGLPFHQGVGTYGSRFPLQVMYCSAKGRKAHKGDILFSVRAPVGRLNIANCEMIIGRGLAAIRHKEGHNSYLYYLLKAVFAREDIIGNGSIFNSVGKDELAKFQVLQPDDELVLKFQSATATLDQHIEILSRSVENLTRTRNMLLPRLISGRLSVANLDIQFPPGMAEELNAEQSGTTHA